MLGRPQGVRVWARTRPTDLRLGFRGLAGLVETEFHHDLKAGDVYLFVNRRCSSAKALLWDGSGLCIYAKKLVRRRFARLWRDASPGQPLRLTTVELNLFLEGVPPRRAPDGRGRRR